MKTNFILMRKIKININNYSNIKGLILPVLQQPKELTQIPQDCIIKK